MDAQIICCRLPNYFSKFGFVRILASLQKLLRPTVVQILVNTFFAAQLRNAVLASQTFQYDPDLLFG